MCIVCVDEPREGVGPVMNTWKSIIDLLEKWYANPGLTDDETFDRPVSTETLVRVLRWANGESHKIGPIPHRVVPDGEGGVTFEFRGVEAEHGKRFTSINIGPAFAIDIDVFEDCRLVMNQRKLLDD